MAEEETQRGSTKRQIARLIGNASTPIYILGDDFRLLFANDALAQLIGVDPELLIGLDCSRNIPVDSSELSRIATVLALPPNADRGVANLYQLFLPGDVVPRLCVTVPLESTPQPMLLCAIKEDHGDCDALLLSGHQSYWKQLLSSMNSDSTPAAELWFLRGTSPSASRALKQIHAACNDRLGVHVSGSAASANLSVAKWIAWKRRSSVAENASPGAFPGFIVVECQLMDRELLRGTLEMIDEQSRLSSKSHGPVIVILHQVDLLADSLIEPFVRWNPASNVTLLATSSSADLVGLHTDSLHWGEFAASLESHVVSVPSLAQRIVDIEALLVAWRECACKREDGSDRIRWNQGFMDAMLAYSWPGDIAEFDAVMRDATQRCPGQQLSEHDLPSSLRTFPSHMRRAEPLAKINLDRVLEQMERDIIQQAMAQFPRNRTAAANHLGISRSRLLRRLQQLGLEKVDATPLSDSEEPIFEDWNEGFPSAENTDAEEE